MSEWMSPRHAETVTAYRAAVEAGGHDRPARRWAELFGRPPRRRCPGGVMVVDPATGNPYTVSCGCAREH
ncbi:hypothetical protein AB0D04_02000 [Streptomyces sp. NPDC048483]|uniref:hypothetical protein n=1 Tax=Streptomyces sp. NPDC048483 TaxID=3154927 RepID=UPI0034184BF2